MTYKERNLNACRTVEEVDAFIKSARVDQERHKIATYHRSHMNNPYDRELGRLFKLKKLLEAGIVDIKQYNNNGFIIGGKIITGFHKKRCRKKGTNRWYWYKKEEDLLDLVAQLD